MSTIRSISPEYKKKTTVSEIVSEIGIVLRLVMLYPNNKFALTFT